MPGDLVTSGEIAEMLGVSRPRVHQLSQRADFPAPADYAGRYRLWRRSAVQRWAKAWDRTNRGGRPARPKQ